MGLPDPESLLRTADGAARKAYAPYSGFRVGAALVTRAGAILAGCNVENASYPVGGCAERHAIAAAVAAEGPEMLIAAIAILALDPVGEPIACAPCGACRQAIVEFGAEAEVIFHNGAKIVRTPAGQLLPGAFAFDPVQALKP